MLTKLGYQVVARTSSLEAIEAFKANPDKFDLIISDMTMPNMTGDMLAGEITKIRSDIPIIICTGFSEQLSDAKTQHALGIKGFLMKPLTIRRTCQNGPQGSRPEVRCEKNSSTPPIHEWRALQEL